VALVNFAESRQQLLQFATINKNNDLLPKVPKLAVFAE